MSGSYLIAADEVIDETEVSRSRFICYLNHCDSNEAARAYIKHIQQLHPQANHHCYAFVSSAPNDSQCYGFSDDGEPSGTAGRPMLSMLQGSGVGEVCAVVVRYFGGTKLGTGGLQRAYGGSVKQALPLLKTIKKVPQVLKALTCEYSQVNEVLRLVEGVGGQVVKQEFLSQVDLLLSLPVQQLSQVEKQLRTLSSGLLVLQSVKD